MKIISFISLLMFCCHLKAEILPGMLSVKERLRLSLWYEGLSPQQRPIAPLSRPRRPEELERALRRM